LLYERNFKERKYSILIDRRSRNEEALKKKMKKQQQQQQEGTKDMHEQRPTIQRLHTSKKQFYKKLLSLQKFFNRKSNIILTTTKTSVKKLHIFRFLINPSSCAQSQNDDDDDERGCLTGSHQLWKQTLDHLSPVPLGPSPASCPGSREGEQLGLARRHPGYHGTQRICCRQISVVCGR
jgi:hypothetical protein